jgi:hypothetical protein
MGTECTISKAWHARQGYETCGCGRPQCCKRRADERGRMRRIERRQWRRTATAA